MSAQIDYVDLEVETMRHVVVDLVLELRGLLPLVESATVPGRSSAELYVSAAALQVEAKLVRQERADRVRHAKDRIVPPGYAAAPANIRSLQVLVEAAGALARVEASAAEEVRVCLARQVEPTTADQLEAIADLAAAVTDPTWLGWAAEELAPITRSARHLLAGAAAAPFPGLCPHCDRPTLVRHKDEGLIRCEGDRSTGRKETCLCGDDTCACVRGVRHEWWQGHTNGWQRLAGQIRHADSVRPAARTSSTRTA